MNIFQPTTLVTILIASVVFFFVFRIAKALVEHWTTVYTVWTTQSALLFRHGRFVRILSAGRHRFWGRGWTLQVYDNRLRELTVSGQEILTSDKATLKVTAVAMIRVADALRHFEASSAAEQPLYSAIQLALRELVGGAEIDEILEKKVDFGTPLLERARAAAAQIGLEVDSIAIRDLMLGGELKQAYASVIHARATALAGLEKARGEAAKIRTLANAARAFENNPQLMQLRYLETIGEAAGQYGNTVIFGTPEDWAKAKV